MTNPDVDRVTKKNFWDKRIVLATQIFLTILSFLFFLYGINKNNSIIEGIASNCFTAFVVTLLFTIIDWNTETDIERAVASVEKETKERIEEMHSSTQEVSNSLLSNLSQLDLSINAFSHMMDIYSGKSCTFCKNSIKAVKLNRDDCDLQFFFEQAKESICILATNLKSFTDYLPIFSQKVTQGVQVRIATVHPNFARSFNISNLVGRNGPQDRWQEMKSSLEQFLSFAEAQTEGKIEIKTYCTQTPTLVLMIVDQQCYVSYLLHAHKSRETPHFLFDGTVEYTATPFNGFKTHFEGIWNDKGTVPTNYSNIHNLTFLPIYAMTDYRFEGWEYASSVFSSKYGISICDYYDILLRVWSKETCTPRMKNDWSAKNPSVGQCTITAFLVQDYFGGDVFAIEYEAGHYHSFNVINDIVFDLTSEQFSNIQNNYLLNRKKQLRDEHFKLNNGEKYERYKKLKSLCEEQMIRRFRVDSFSE